MKRGVKIILIGSAVVVIAVVAASGIGLDSDFYICRMVPGRESNFSPQVG
jgi:hypothetical protein